VTVSKPYIVCGWYTPDYAHWLDTLIPSLERVGAPHHFIETTKRPDGWERNTMMKAEQIREALRRHPDQTIIFIDVDCQVLGPLDALATIDTDFACFIETKASPKRASFQAWSGTLVFRQTPRARALVDLWAAESRVADRYAVDQTTLASVISRIPGLTITALDRKWCARPWDGVLDAVILHDSASLKAKTPRWRQKWHRRMARLGFVE